MNTDAWLGGSRVVHGVTLPALRYRAASSVDVLDDIAAAGWVQTFDAAWLGHNWDALGRFLAPDVEFLPQGQAAVMTGRAAVLAHLQRHPGDAVVHEYSTTGLRARVSRSISIVTFRWQLECTADGQRRIHEGRDMLALRAVDEGWQLAWRIQLRS